jgi:hypothetical protein
MACMAPHSAFGTRTWLFLSISACLIAPLSLFVHDFMLETLKIPYPTTVDLPHAVKFLNDLVRLFALGFICRLSRSMLQIFSRTLAALFVGLISRCLRRFLPRVSFSWRR